MLSDPNKKRQYDLHGEDASTNELGEKISICELRKKIRTRTRARTLARVRCACEKAFKPCVRCACVRPFFGVCDVRSQFRTFLDKKGPILAFDFVNTNILKVS